MRELESQDVYWINRRIPLNVRQVLLANRREVFVAGGFIRACIAGESPNDIDLFTSSKDKARDVATRMLTHGKGLRMIETDNAFTVLGLFVAVQFIHRWTFTDPKSCVESFDCTIARAAVWFGEKKDDERHPLLMTCCDDRFYADLASKRLIYCSPVRNEDAGGSMLRVLKFYQRGYRIPLDSLGAVMARMACAVDYDRLELSAELRNATKEQRMASVFTGLLHEVDPDIDPDHLSHLPAITSAN